MFVRTLKHKNGRNYIQVVSKSSGKYKVLQSFGSAHTDAERDLLVGKAEHWIKLKSGVQELDFGNEAVLYQKLLESISSHKLVGIDLVLGKIFNEIGFNQVKDSLFKDLVLLPVGLPQK